MNTGRISCYFCQTSESEDVTGPPESLLLNFEFERFQLNIFLLVPISTLHSTVLNHTKLSIQI